MKKFIHYKHYEVDRKKYETGVKVLDNYTWATDNMDEPVNCICYEKELTYGECYTSKRWYSFTGLWGLWVCPECYKKESQYQVCSYPCLPSVQSGQRMYLGLC